MATLDCMGENIVKRDESVVCIYSEMILDNMGGKDMAVSVTKLNNPIWLMIKNHNKHKRTNEKQRRRTLHENAENHAERMWMWNV